MNTLLDNLAFPALNRLVGRGVPRQRGLSMPSFTLHPDAIVQT